MLRGVEHTSYDERPFAIVTQPSGITGIISEYFWQWISGGVPLLNWWRHTAKYLKQVIPMASVVNRKNGFMMSNPIAEEF